MMELFADVDIDMIIKLSISAILGLTIGLERELKRKPLGLKTSLVISIVSCLLTIVSIQSAYLFPGSKYINIQMDPLRLAAQIVSGIGFLGAGVIMRKGTIPFQVLTTAAMVWGAAGIGIATGAGFYFEAIAGVILLIISVELIPGLIRILGVKRLRSKELRVRLTLKKQEDIASVLKNIQEKNIKIEHIRIKDLQDQSYLVDLKVMVSYKLTTPDIYYGLAKIDKIYSTEISG